MIPFVKQNKLIVLAIVVVVLGILYYVFFAGKGGNSSLLTSDTSAPSADSQQLLVTLSNLRTIQLDGSIFTDPVFLSLNNFNVTLQPEATGRPNPFAPFVSSSGVQSFPGNLQINNIQLQKLQSPTR